jgi:hypothetical protein
VAWLLHPDTRSRLRSAFRKYPKPKKLEGCPHCVGKREGDPLCLAGLDDITVGMVSRYAAKAISTWGTVDDYKYFLPRLLERYVSPYPVVT